MAHPICPRCGGFIPNNETPGAYPGALSRTTRGENDVPVYVCSACGTAEAMEDFAGGGAAPQSTWLSARRPVDGDTQRSN
jgi:hypothetical protein